ncbi:MAG TPA: hypothetical protein VFD66_07510 [Verrucomicrobiae bacterium]|nr:hypothetical protein [Verrucomicrobiae bacterium]
MKKILLLTGVLGLFATSGCLVSEEGRGHYHGGEGRGHYESESHVVVAPAVIVRPPEVIVR